MLFDLEAGRALTRRPKAASASSRRPSAIDVDEARRLGLTNGVIAEISTGTHHGWLVLWDVPDLSTDFLDFGRELAGTLGALARPLRVARRDRGRGRGPHPPVARARCP